MVAAAERASSRRHGLHGDRRGKKLRITHFMLKDIGDFRSFYSCDIGAGATHVEGDELGESGTQARLSCADHTARRAREQAIFGAELCLGDETTCAGHDIEGAVLT